MNKTWLVALLPLMLDCAHASEGTSALVVERTKIVDCLLPGKVRKLGINRQYVTRKRPTKTSANECAIRGGDYVEFDRASIASSLAVWQEAAASGDAKAQYYVGETFEKGLGQEPDYPMAVMWYQRATEQNYAPAKLSLGRLYEKGLGVDKDLVKAMNLYRQASGLDEEEIAYASVFEKLKEQDEAEIALLRVELASQKRKSKSILRKKEVLQSDLDRSKGTVKKLKDEIRELNRKLDQSSQVDAEALEGKLNNAIRELDSENGRAAKLERQLESAESELKMVRTQLAALAPDGKPAISMKWPQFEPSDVGFESKVPSGSVVNVVGVVRGFANVKSFQIDGETYTLDANGLFLKTLDVGREAVDLKIEIVDQNGEKTQSTLTVTPSDGMNIVLRGAGSLTSKKLRFGNYHALIIGNNNYDLEKGWEPLDTAVNDAKAIAKVLEQQYGFKVRLELNADRDTMLTAIEEMRRELTAKDNLLVYYAGHGLVDPENNQGYWVPIDGSTQSAVRWISNASITDQIRAMTARNVMVIADSCYSGSLMRSGIVTLRSGLTAEKKALRLGDDVRQLTRVALSSGGIQPAIDSYDNSDHSVFAEALLDILSKNNELLDADSLATQVAHAVAMATNDSIKQVPRYAPLAAGGHQGGEFYFAPLSLVE